MELVSPHRINQYPRWADLLVRALRLLQYGGSIIAGAALILVPSPSVHTLMAMAFNNVLGIVLLVGGTVCLIGSALMRWVWEWVASFFVTGAIGIFAVAIWTAAAHEPVRLAGAGAIAMLFFALAIRSIDLTVYWIKNVRTARIKRGMDE